MLGSCPCLTCDIIIFCKFSANYEEYHTAFSSSPLSLHLNQIGTVIRANLSSNHNKYLNNFKSFNKGEIAG